MNLVLEKNIKLNKNLFVFGNIAPDLHIGFMKEKHYKKFCYEKLKENIIKLSQTKMTLKEFSFNAGIICHYLSDIFCYPHEQEWFCFKGNTKEHLFFEEKQSLLTNNKIFVADKNLEIKDFEMFYIDFFIESLLDEYKNSIDYSRDIKYAVNVAYTCVEKMLFKMFQQNVIVA